MKKTLQICSLVAISLFTKQRAIAQLDSTGNLFLRASHAEAGIAPMGWFGSTSAAPTGYHADFTGGKLGFVADPDLDGWTVGSPAFFGDYFMPGTPFEGWELQIDSLRAQAFGTGTITAGLTGSNTTYTSAGSANTGTWEGYFNGITIKQETTLDTNTMFYVIRITLTNTDTIAHNNIYYMRTVDPDNDEMQPGGSFPTNNTIDYNFPADSISLVSAIPPSLHPQAYLGLGSADTNSRALVYSSWPLNATTDLATVYNETCGTLGSVIYSGTMPDADVAIGLLIYVGHLAPVDSASDSVLRSAGMHPANMKTFTFFYAFSPEASDSALAQTRVVNTTTQITNPNQQAIIKVYPNPTKSELNITGLAATDKVQLLDMVGKVVKNNFDVTNSYHNVYKLDNLTAGQYLLIVKDEQGNVKTRVRVEKN